MAYRGRGYWNTTENSQEFMVQKVVRIHGIQWTKEAKISRCAQFACAFTWHAKRVGFIL